MRIIHYTKEGLNAVFNACGTKWGNRTMDKRYVTCKRCKRTKLFKAKEKKGRRVIEKINPKTATGRDVVPKINEIIEVVNAMGQDEDGS